MGSLQGPIDLAHLVPFRKVALADSATGFTPEMQLALSAIEMKYYDRFEGATQKRENN